MEQQSESWVVRILTILRIAQTFPYLTVVAKADLTTGYTSPRIVLTLYTVYVLWSIGLFTASLRRGVVTWRLAAVDAALTVGCAFAMVPMFKGDAAAVWLNWTVGPWMATAILAGLYLPFRWSIPVGLLALLAYGAQLSLAVPRAAAWNAFLGNATVGVLFAVGAYVGTTALRRLSMQADLSAAAALEAKAAEAALAERVRQSDILHNTAIQTLTLLARDTSGLNPELRERCLRDVQALRMGLVSVRNINAVGLLARLTNDITSLQAHLHLEVSFTHDEVPADVPAEVIDELARAVVEALNNVVKYAETNQVIVVVAGDEEGLTITVTDKGKGFDPQTTTHGYGLSQPLGEGVRRNNIAVTIVSYRGLGTSVELRWTR